MKPQKKASSSSFQKKLIITGAVFLFLVLVIASFFGKRGLIEIYRAQKKKENLVQEVTQLTLRRDKLLREIWELENNPRAVENKARERLWLMSPDELVIVK